MKAVMEPFKRLVGSSEHSKPDNFKKLSILAQILSFLLKNTIIGLFSQI